MERRLDFGILSFLARIGPNLRVLLVLSLLACGACSDAEGDITVTLSGLTPDVFTVKLSATLNGIPAQSPIVINKLSSNYYFVRLNPNAAGNLALNATGFSEAGCPLVEGTTMASEDPRSRVDLTIALHQTTSHWVKQPENDSEYKSSGLFVLDDNNVWVAGVAGDVLYWNGSTWVQQFSSPTAAFSRLWASDASHIWVIGLQGSSRWDVKTSTFIALSDFRFHNALWGSDADNVWFVDSDGSITKWIGSFFLPQSSGVDSPLYSVWGTDETNVWTVGAGGVILKWDGLSWSPQRSGTTKDRVFPDQSTKLNINKAS